MGRHRWATQGALHTPEQDDGGAGEGERRGPRFRLTVGVVIIALVCLAVTASLILIGKPEAPLAAVTLDDEAVHQTAPPAQDSAGAESGSPAAPSLPADQTRADQSASSDDKALVIHVAGAVSTPGVVSLPAGSRTFEAIDKAGGALPDAALDAINLAAPLADGVQLYVPRIGEQHVPGAAAAAGEDQEQGPVNLNSATTDELQELPGVGPVLAERIISWREEHGGFSRVADLDAVSGVGEAIMASLAELVTV